MTRPLNVGLLLPDIEGMYDGAMVRWSDIADIARTAEAVGFDSLWLGDHLLYRFPDMGSFGIWEAWSVLCGLAATTERVELGTIVMVTPWRAPALLAKMATTVDEISGGRLILGLGAGSFEPEFPAFGFHTWGDRVSRFEEELGIIRTLLRDGRIDHEGRYHTLRDCELRPLGPRPQGPPIMVGAVGPRMLRLTATHADQWNIPWKHTLEEVTAQIERGKEACRAVGRDPATLDYSVCLQVDVPDRPSRLDGMVEQARAGAVRGSYAEIAELLRSYARAGVSHVQLWIDPSDPPAIEAFGALLQELDGGR